MTKIKPNETYYKTTSSSIYNKLRSTFSNKIFIFKSKKVKAYGVVNYYSFDCHTDLEWRNTFDTEKLNAYIKYNFSDKIQLKTEFEFEHGGTGITMELDKFKEFFIVKFSKF